MDLAHTDIRRRGLAALVTALIASQRVERLFLDANSLDEQDAEPLARLIRTPSSLRELYLDNNRLGDAGGKLLAQAVQSVAEEENGLEVLTLGSNGLTEPGYLAWAEALAADPPLRRLHLAQARSAAIYQAPSNVGSPRAAAALLTALESNRHLEQLALGRKFPRAKEIRRQLVGPKPETAPPSSLPADMLAVRSVYRTPSTRQQSPSTPPKPRPEESAQPPASTLEAPPVEMLSVSDDDLATCSRVLGVLRQRADVFFDDPERWSELRADANRLVAAVQKESRRRKALRKRPASDPRKSRKRNQQRDRQLVEQTEIRRQRSQAASAGRLVSAGAPDVREAGDLASSSGVPLAHSRRCHICKDGYSQLDAFYDALCPTCAELNQRKRAQSKPLDEQVAVLTGGRVKIGHQIALKLLRAGATVYTTTRFPCSAAQRFAAYDDFAQWQQRLKIVGIDLRHLPSVERLGAKWAELPRLDILINNAAQTIRRPPAFYAPLLGDETAGVDALPAAARACVDVDASQPGAAQLSQRALLPEDTSAALFFPAGGYQEDGQQLDLRPSNSWSLELGEVSTLELLEVHAINALAPFVLLRHLQPLMVRTHASRLDHDGGYVINVSAMEGSFSRRFKNSTHPHTNMAKAALNMMTRTCGPRLAEQGVYMNSVDTGWITDEQPHPVRQRIQQQGFEPPLDEVDGAARVLDPIFSGNREGGLFLKDYVAIDW